MSDEIADLVAKMFIARKDVKAIQHSNGAYTPDRTKWKRADLLAHLSGEKTYGHYVVNPENQVKLFCFDVDFEKMGWLPTEPDEEDIWREFQPCMSLRDAWHDRKHVARLFMKSQLHGMAHKLVAGVQEFLDIPCAVAYSGNKGVHVYGFTGLINAGDARIAANIVLDGIGEFEPKRGEHYFQVKAESAERGEQNLSIEVYPKQDSLENKDLGNLLRLPLGRNLKSTDPTFFVDMAGPMNSLNPIDSLHALTSGNPFKLPGE